MRVSSRMMLNNYIFTIMGKEAALNKMNEQISSGNMISVPSDDPIGAARIMSLNTSLNETQQYQTNSNNAMSWLTATDTALSTAVSYLQRVNELVINGANSDKPGNAFNDLAKEIDQIRDGLVDVANTTIGTNYIFAGTNVTNPAYEERTPATGDARDLAHNPIQINLSNNQFKVKLDQGTTQTITLTPGVYDGTSGKTLNDLAADIQKQLKAAGFDLPVYAKATPDNRIVFYAGANPPDGQTHSLVLTDGPAIKTTGTARLPSNNPPAGQICLDGNANKTNNYYNGWTIRITSGAGVGQSRVITGYNGVTQTANVDTNWAITPDNTSTYSIIPPLNGSSTAAATAGTNTITLDAANSSQVDSFYTGMTISITSGTGAGEARKIVSYDHTTGIATLDSNWTTAVPSGSNYILSPPLTGAVQSAANVTAAGTTTGTITLDTIASATDNFYAGASITVANATGSTETKRIVSYDATTKTATLDSAWTLPPTNTSTYSISDTSLSQLGFYNKSTTKELVGTALSGTVQVTGSYPVTGLAQSAAAAGTNNVTFPSSTSSAENNFYNGWTLTVTDGAGKGQTRTITGYDGTTATATVDGPWLSGLDTTSKFSLTPPLNGQVAAVAGANNQIVLNGNASASQDFYKGMPITITSGNGVNQTRNIIAYDPATQTATVDSPWSTLPDTTSRYSIDANYYVNANSKFKITVGLNPPQEISLGAGVYSVKDLAKEIQTQVQARGGSYANVYVSATPENQLRFSYQDPTVGEDDNPLSIKLEAGSTADILTTIGFNSGVSSETALPTYEGDQGLSEYEINYGTKIAVNVVGDKLFDPIIQHLTRISQDLRNGDSNALSNVDIKNVQSDLNQLTLAQGECGAKQNRLQNGLDRLSSFQDNITKMLSNIQDTDISQMALEWKTQQTAYQAALMIGSKILPATLMDYLR